MKQILQDLKSGHTVVQEIPCPGNHQGHVLIGTAASLVSVGTEKMLVVMLGSLKKMFDWFNWLDWLMKKS